MYDLFTTDFAIAIFLNMVLSYLLLENYIDKQIRLIKRKEIDIKILGLANTTAVLLFGVFLYLAIMSNSKYLVLIVRLISIALCSPLFALFYVVRIAKGKSLTAL